MPTKDISVSAKYYQVVQYVNFINNPFSSAKINLF